MRRTLGILVWAVVATVWGVALYRATNQTRDQLASATARSEGLEALLADDHYGVIDVDANGIVTGFNSGAELLTNQTESQAVGRHVSELICGEIGAKLAHAFEVRRETPELAKVEVQNCDMIGSAVPVRCRMYATESQQSGEIVGVVLVDPQANVKITE